MDLLVVVPIWDTETQHPYTRRCALDLAHNTQHPSMTAVFVDNASPFAASRQHIEALLPRYPTRLHLIANDDNKGYGGGANQGLLWGYDQGAQTFIVCNNDIAFLSPVWYENLLKPLPQYPRSLVGPRLIPNNEWVHFDGRYYPYLEGFMLAFSRRFLDEVGYFDEIFTPAWVEDVELSWRAARHGYTLIESQSVPIWHAYGRTSYDGRTDFMAVCAQNVEKFKAKVHADDHSRIGPPAFRSDCHPI